jgi:hypothetical protein
MVLSPEKGVVAFPNLPPGIAPATRALGRVFDTGDEARESLRDE